MNPKAMILTFALAAPLLVSGCDGDKPSTTSGKQGGGQQGGQQGGGQQGGGTEGGGQQGGGTEGGEVKDVCAAGKITQADVLKTLAEDVFVPGYEAFQADAEALNTAVAAYAKAPTPATRTAAQGALKKAMDAWQQLEVMRLGPAAPEGRTSGQGLRDRIYSWPMSHGCYVDQGTVVKTYEDLSSALPHRTGLGALAYLLNTDSTDTACEKPPALGDNKWVDLSPAEIKARRLVYAKAIAEDVAANAKTLVNKWKNPFRNHLIRVENGVFKTEKAAMQELLWSIFYLEKVTKDVKLGKSMGVNDCAKDCHQLVEGPWTKRSKAYIVENLKGVRMIFVGGRGDAKDGAPKKGLAQLLCSMDAGPLANSMLTELDTAIAKVEAIPGTLYDALQKDPGKVRDAYDAVKAFTNHLKGEFRTTLTLNIPTEAAGDAD